MRPTNRVIAVAGVTGGCGATTMAINIAFEISQTHPTLRVVLAELSLQVGKLPLYLNVEPRLTTHDLLKDIHRIDLYFMQQALTPVVEGFSILAGPYHAVAPLSEPGWADPGCWPDPADRRPVEASWAARRSGLFSRSQAALRSRIHDAPSSPARPGWAIRARRR